jgi:site-specific DNA recombinase
MRIALYARVSTERQEREQTIAQQVTALREALQQEGHTVPEEAVFTDAAVSGARLDRPGLEALRDACEQGHFEQVWVTAPDRLARDYVNQMLVLRELERQGMTVRFLNQPTTDEPNGKLLVQVQSIIAEYERSLILDRCRRGRIAKAKAGQTFGRAALGYRRLPSQAGLPGVLVEEPEEAALVRQMFRWVGEEGLSLRAVCQRLNAPDQPVRPQQGECWRISTVRAMLTNETYAGTAHYLQRESVVPERPQREGFRAREKTSTRLRAREEWIAIPVLALISPEEFDQVQAQLARNAAQATRNNTRHRYELRGLLRCGACGRRLCGKTWSNGKRVYVCPHKDPLRTGQVCAARPVSAQDLEGAVWAEVQRLLQDPAALLAAHEAHCQAAQEPLEPARQQQTQASKALAEVARQRERLVEAYQRSLLALRELEVRLGQLAERKAHWERQQAEAAQRVAAAQEAQTWEANLRAFCATVQQGLETATEEDRQALLQLVVHQITVSPPQVRIEHTIPVSSPSNATLSPMCFDELIR